MFGYVRPALDLLSGEDRERYQSAYCGLCHTMGKRYGFLSRFTLNYDFTFLAILFEGGGGGGRCTGRCPAHPFRKKRLCVCGGGMDAAADAAMILTWQKLRDDVRDGGFLRGAPARLLCALYGRAYKKAKERLPDFARRVEESLSLLHELEGENSAALDRAADSFARILMAAAPACPEEGRRRILEQLLYHMGRWIYLVDGWDDLEEDRRMGRYNPIEARFEGKTEENLGYLITTVTHSLRLAVSAANLADFGIWQGIVENVLYKGLPTVQEAVFSGRWKELKRRKYNREKKQ